MLGSPTNLDNNMARPVSHAVGAGGGSLDIFFSRLSSISFSSSFSPPPLGDDPI